MAFTNITFLLLKDLPVYSLDCRYQQQIPPENVVLKALDPAKNFQETQRREGLVEMRPDDEVNKIQILGNSTAQMAQGLQQVKLKEEIRM